MVKRIRVLAAIYVLLAFLPSCRSAVRFNSRTEQLEMYVPAGQAVIGEYQTNLHGIMALDLGQVSLPGYWISQTQVTNAQYHKCQEAGACQMPVGPERNPYYYLPAYANHPVVYVTWYEAQQFCQWAGGRLPHEIEWEKAARGPNGSSYPWGDSADVERRARIDRAASRETTLPVGSFVRGQSAYGVLDMGSNVREWIDDWFDDSRVVLRGAAWYDPPAYALAFARLAHEPGSAGQGRGFRCVFEHSLPNSLDS